MRRKQGERLDGVASLRWLASRWAGGVRGGWRVGEGGRGVEWWQRTSGRGQVAEDKWQRTSGRGQVADVLENIDVPTDRASIKSWFKIS